MTAEGSKEPQTQSPHLVRGYPIVGILPQLFRDPTGTIERAARDFPGEVVPLRLGPTVVYLVSHPDHVQHILSDSWRKYVKGSMWNSLRRLLGNGLVTSEGELWLHNRRLMQPLFSASRFASLAEYITEGAVEATNRLESLAPGAIVDMSLEMTRLTQAIILKAFFGSSVGPDEADRLGRAVLVALREINLRMFLFFLPQWLPFPGEAALRRAVCAVDEFVFSLVRERRKNPVSRDDLLSLLIRLQDDAGVRMDDQQLRDELVTMFVAGNDTTSAALTWVWYSLDEHPEVDRKLRAELDTVLGGRAPTFADLANLPYTKMVIQESLRLYPPAWFFPRVALEDDTIGGRHIPAGATLLLSPYATHRDPKFWDEAARFDPDRFASERSLARHRYAYFPFGGGPRQCLGNFFAVIEAQLIVATMAQKIRLRRRSRRRIELQSATLLRPRGGLEMILNQV